MKRWLLNLACLALTACDASCLIGAPPDPTKVPNVVGVFDGKPIEFALDVRENVANAAIDLLRSCHHSDSTATKNGWDNALKKPHLRVTFAKPRSVDVLDETVEVPELVVTFPLSTGGLWVRSGDKVLYFAKYEYPTSQKLEAWLREAEPAR
jgi:hypothetical protein